MSIDAPLTYGQRSTWRSMQEFAHDRLYEVNVPATWDVRGLSTRTVLTGLQRLVDRNESLRTTYHLLDGEPVQRIADTLAPRIEFVRREGFDPAEAARTTRQLQLRPFPVQDDPGWRAVLACRDDGRPLYLALSLSHMVVDLHAVEELRAQFQLLTQHASHGSPGSIELPAEAATETPATETPTIEVQATETPATDLPTPRQLAREQLGEEWASRRRGAEKYWRRLLATGPVRNLAGYPEAESGSRIQVNLRSYRLAGLTAESAAAHGVSPQSVLMAATAAALSEIVGQDRVMLSVMSANRFDRQWRSMITTMNQLMPLACEVPADLPVGRFLKRAHLQALMAYRHSAYDVDEARRWARESGTELVHDCWFNYVAEPPAEQPALPGFMPGLGAGSGLPPAELSWVPPARQAGHPFYLRVNGDGRTWVTLGLRVDPELVPAPIAVRALRTVVRVVSSSVTEPDAELGRLLAPGARDLTELPEVLFPTEFAPVPAG